MPNANRALAVDRLSPRRDVGALGTLSAGRYATIWAAVVDGEGPNTTGNPDDRQMVMGRLTLFPLPSLGLSGKWLNQGPDHRWGYDARWPARGVIVEGEVLRRSAPTSASATIDASDGYALAAVRPLAWLQPVVKWEQLHTRTITATGSSDARVTRVTYGLNLMAPRDRLRLQLEGAALVQSYRRVSTAIDEIVQRSEEELLGGGQPWPPSSPREE